jgi:hypothetical protein
MAFVIAPRLEDAEATRVAWVLDLPLREFRHLFEEGRIVVDRGCCGDGDACTTFCYAGREARVHRGAGMHPVAAIVPVDDAA